MHADEREWLDDSTGAISLRRVLVAYDFSPHSELALRHGLMLAGLHQAELHLLHVLAPQPYQDPEIRWVGTDADTQYHEAARRLQQSVPAEAHLWSNVTRAVQ